MIFRLTRRVSGSLNPYPNVSKGSVAAEEGRQKSLRLGPRWPPGRFQRAGRRRSWGGPRVVMGTSGGTSLWSQSGKHFCELCWVGDCLIIEEPQPGFLWASGHSILAERGRYQPAAVVQVKGQKRNSCDPYSLLISSVDIPCDL